MAERNIGTEILEGLREIKAHKAGKVKLRTRELMEPSSAKEIRNKLGISQEAFAGLIGVSPRTLQDWEQGRRKPQGPAKALLRIVEKHPEVLLDEAR